VPDLAPVLCPTVSRTAATGPASSATCLGPRPGPTLVRRVLSSPPAAALVLVLDPPATRRDPDGKERKDGCNFAQGHGTKQGGAKGEKKKIKAAR